VAAVIARQTHLLASFYFLEEAHPPNQKKK